MKVKRKEPKNKRKWNVRWKGVVCGLSRKAAVSLINRNKNSQDKFKI
jgi:hypothetical protein